MSPTQPLLFLKLGGSLITDKDSPATPRPDVLRSLAGQIAQARLENPGLRLLLGHGSGSFGHVTAHQYRTQDGVRSPDEWHGFAQVWLQASRLNRLIIEALHSVGLPAVTFAPSAGAVASQRQVASWHLAPIRHALQAGLLPVVYGDVAFDKVLGGTILSTEMVFAHLAEHLMPQSILIAGIEPGVWEDFPACTRIFPEITHHNLEEISNRLMGSRSIDVTGGMATKVREMLALCKRIPGLQVSIFSGEEPDAIRQALLGERLGTQIFSPHS